jgi:hypothetical protein
MKKKLLFSGLIGLIAIAYFSYLLIRETPKSQPTGNEFHVLIKFKRGLISAATLQHKTTDIKSQAIAHALATFHVASLTGVFKNRYNEQGELKATLANNNQQAMEGWQKVSLPSQKAADAFLQAIITCEGVEYAQLDNPIVLKPAVAPNDPSYTNNGQWHLNDPINTTADIDAPEAWDINKGRNDVILAILDGGVDYNHRDMDPGNRSRVIAGIDTGDGDNDPLDNLPYNDPLSYAGHGTSVAGITGALTNNSTQVAGVMWNCKIMPVKMVGNGSMTVSYPFGRATILNYSTTAFPSDVANAIDYAVNNGAHVINLSYGIHGMGWVINDIILKIPVLFQTINNAYLNNVVTTVAMGNEYKTDNSPSYPAAFNEQVIPVGATGQDRTRAAFSNTGSHISVSAPGVGITTTARGGGIRTFNGTSAAAPIAAGVAGLIISQGKDRNFNLTNNDVKHIIELTASDVTGNGYSVGFDEQTGYGIVNAKNALQLLAPPNVLYHYTSTGGTSTKINTFSKWILTEPRWGLAPGTYLNVDQYKITRHITFNVPFCTVPKVWTRERESTSLNYANPNSGRPTSFITNVTTTGFDLEYATYYVRYNVLGQQINQWIPTYPGSSTVAYTAVGHPNLAAIATVSGPSIICSTDNFTILNNPNNSTLTWSTSNPSGLSINSSGLATRVNGFNGQVTVTATINSGCGSVTLPGVNVVVGSPAPQAIAADVQQGLGRIQVSTMEVPGANSYNWYINNVLNSTYKNVFAQLPISRSRCNIEYSVSVAAVNPCGTSSRFSRNILVPCTGSSQVARVSASTYPNPSSSTLTVQVTDSLATDPSTDKLEQPYELHLVDKFQRKVISVQSSDKILHLSTEDLTPDVYYLQVQYKDAITRKQIVIRK